jgi:hypothetical protein
MIATVADLVEELVAKEKAVIEKQPGLNHMPMLGDMYEGLAKHLVRAAIFKGLDLNVVDGKVRLKDGTITGQIDVMVVEGQGTQLPFTEHWIYPIENVVAVFEVKKTLYGGDLADAFIHLQGVREAKPDLEERYVKMIKDAWRSIMRKSYPTNEEQKHLPLPDEVIRTTLFLDSHRPLRIILGYDGFKSERTLRSGLVDFLNGIIPMGKPQNPPVAGFGVPDLPDLIICGRACIAKLDGMPMAQPRRKDGFWPILASHAGNPFRTMLELLWTRLAYRHNLSASIFGDDLEFEVMNELAACRFNEAGKGWEYRVTDIPAAVLAAGPKYAQWSPEKVTRAEFVVVNQLCNDVTVRLDDPGLIKFLKDDGTTPKILADSLEHKNLVFIQDGEIKLLTDQCAALISPANGGEFLVGENKTGRLARWIARQMEAKEQKQPEAS